jgi:hypothetical protein
MIYANIPKSKPKRKPGWQAEELKYQEHLKKLGINPYQKATKQKFKELTPVKLNIRETKHIPSLNTNVGNTSKVETIKYTGDKLIGIAVLHKSCLQPVFSKQDATDIARMRR